MCQAAIDRAQALKVRGNAQFAALQYPLALETYREGLVELPLVSRLGEALRSQGASLGDLTAEGNGSSEGAQTLEASEAVERQICDEQVRELRAALFGNVAAALIKLVSITPSYSAYAR